METVKTALRTFFRRKFPGQRLADDDDIFAQGLASSLLVMQLVRLVEREAGVELGEEDLEMTNFRSIDAMVDLVTRKRSAVPSAARHGAE